jgi:hypothetical protein
VNEKTPKSSEHYSKPFIYLIYFLAKFSSKTALANSHLFIDRIKTASYTVSGDLIDVISDSFRLILNKITKKSVVSLKDVYATINSRINIKNSDLKTTQSSLLLLYTIILEISAFSELNKKDLEENIQVLKYHINSNQKEIAGLVLKSYSMLIKENIEFLQNEGKLQQHLEFLFNWTTKLTQNKMITVYSAQTTLLVLDKWPEYFTKIQEELYKIAKSMLIPNIHQEGAQILIYLLKLNNSTFPYDHRQISSILSSVVNIGINQTFIKVICPLFSFPKL